jgi:prophage maintenance system killer protein
MAEGDGEPLTWLDTFVQSIREFHDNIIQTSGGLLGERTSLLCSACARPFHTFDGNFVHPDPLHQAAALFHGIVSGHGFVDGCKLTGTMAAFYLLVVLDVISIDNLPSADEVEAVGEIAVRIASGESMTVAQIAEQFSAILSARLVT